ncbi:MAG: peptidoglycan-binding domain-containing protein [Paracoccaceae bacterium]|nr:peptidoglycan-binding domain-containing protein [Paracoccaceae bacterium]
MIRSTALLAIAAIALVGCTLSNGVSQTQERPDGAEAGTCWAKQIKPAVIQTSTTQSVISGQDGETIYQTETSQSIVEEHQEVWFQIPCQNVMTSEFIASVQRGLSARGYYAGPINGRLDTRTAKSIRLMQVPLGIDSQVLSILGARHLGLIIIPIE